MNSINAKNLRLELKETLLEVEKGKEFLIIYNSRPMAKLVPVEGNSAQGNAIDFVKFAKERNSSRSSSSYQYKGNSWKEEYYNDMEDKYLNNPAKRGNK
jgi:antitoxin (DNA-binding transcriptional repressor) of toxin-antitoxin stability system